MSGQVAVYGERVAPVLHSVNPTRHEDPNNCSPSRYVRAHASVRCSPCRRLLPRLGYQSAIWAIAHRLCRVAWKILHEDVDYIEQGIGSEPQALMHRAKYLARQLRKFGYDLRITATNPTIT